MAHGFDNALAERGDGQRIYRVGPLDCLVWHVFIVLGTNGTYKCRVRVLRYYPSSTPSAYRFESIAVPAAAAPPPPAEEPQAPPVAPVTKPTPHKPSPRRAKH